MQEDKASKWLASELRKHQEENRLPYELGAWEAFQAKRAATVRKKSPYWISGIAATVILVLVAGGLWLAQETESGDHQLSQQIALEEKSTSSPVQEPAPTNAEKEISESKESNEVNSKDREAEHSISVLDSKLSDQSESDDQAATPIGDQSEPNAFELLKPKPVHASPLKSEGSIPERKKSENLPEIESALQKENTLKTTTEQTLVATNEKAEVENATLPVAQNAVIAQAELPKDPQLSDEEIKEILETKSFASLAMGVSPGFGASSNSEQATSGSSLGLGVMVDMAISRKLVMGSGLAVNYLNQASESQSYNGSGINAAGFSVTETNEINQVQLDIPLYFKYPITRNDKISVQAGFSNLITFNQGAEQEASYTRQVAVYDALAANSFRLQSESVSQTQDLNVSDQQFYPFATANFGLNIRLFESKKTSYEVMPFYNYPLQEFSGYGEKLGMFGASFKVNFGAVQKK
ncbi:hypothetical protein GCM10009119_17100 [Algoriphagus jejuensis]|uniref:Outer membrane protein with beta-barrel domain n=1 Tax=Algoriphagus jejuensis TaxID=419934 RepID=A0ABP3YCW9_9BACT